MISKKIFLSIPLLAMGLAVALPVNNYQASLATATTKDRYELNGSTAKLSWGVYDYGGGLAGFANGNIADASDTLLPFTIQTEGDYKVVFHYFAGSYPNATAPKRLLNFITNGRQNIKELTIDASFDWSVPHNEEFYLHLDEGRNTIILQGEHGPDSCVNADKLEIYDSSDELIATLEAEEGVLVNTGIPAPGIVAGFENRNRPSADVVINVSKAGLYTLGINYAGGPDGTAPEVRSLNIGVNAEGKTNAYEKIDFNATGDWGNYTINEFDVQLDAGSNVITIQACPGIDSKQSSLNLTDLYVSLSGYQQALDFSNDYLFMNTVPTTDHSVTENCSKNYNAAVAAFNNLYDEGKNSFLEDSEFEEARARFQAWAKANGQIFDVASGAISNSDSFLMLDLIKDNRINFVLVIIISVTAMALISFLIFRKKRYE